MPQRVNLKTGRRRDRFVMCNHKGKSMKKILNAARALHEDKSGASFIEYTVLLGVILAVSIGTITAVGTWANTQWTLLPP